MKTKKVLSIILAIVMFSSTFVITASAASYSTGNYKVATSSGVNVRSGAGTGYSVVGASSNGTSFYVSRTSGSWGYTSSIRCTNGTRSGWVCLDYCTKQSGSSSNSNRATYNDVFASVKGSGYSLSQGRSSESTTFTKGTWVYVWGWLHDANNNLYKSYGSGKCNMTLSIYRPNGTCAYSYTYNDCDNNWIGQRLDQVGTWKIQSKISGSLVGTNTRTITVKQPSSSTINPTSVSLSYSALTLSKGSTKNLNATIYPSNATNKTIKWYSSNTSVATVSNGKISAVGIGTAIITAKASNGVSSSCKVKVTGVSTSNITYKYVTVNLDTSSLENWVKSVKNIENRVCSNNGGVIIGAKVTKRNVVSWKVPKAAIYQGPGITGYKTVKYSVPATVKYQVHTHERKMGFGSSWYYANQSIVTVYTCNCGYRKQLMEWEIPLPDTSDAQTTKSVIQGLPKIN